MSRAQALFTMLAVTLMWSIAGVVTRHLDQAQSFEVTFWRSAFNAVALVLLLCAWRGPASLWRSLRQGGGALWTSGVCWCVMFTAFMVALTLTDVANVLVTMALGPLFTALLARAVLGYRLPVRTWLAVALAGVGIAFMYGHAFGLGERRHVLGTLVALGVPVAAAVNWTLLQHLKSRSAAGRDEPGQDMLPAVLLGALLSAAMTLPLAWPLGASAHDLGLLALLGGVQLAVPCLLAVSVARVLSAPEMALLGLLEVIFGVAWAWLGAGEKPGGAVLVGGALVVGALALNEALGLRGRKAVPA